MAQLVHLIRHGQSTANVALALKRVDPMLFDARLSPLGEEQVRAARARHDAIGYDVVLMSPLTRALQTGLGIFGHRADLAFEVEPLHREHVSNSCDIGRSPQELQADFPQLSFGHLPDPWWHSAEDGARNDAGIVIEPHEHVLARVEAFRASVWARPEARIAVIGHGNFFHYLSGTFLDNCGMIALER